MLRWGARGRCGLRCGALILAALSAAVATAGGADARSRRQAAESYDPAYASIVVDANSGAVMQASSADSPRHPASLTKIMTLYLLFERLEAGKIKLSTEMTASAHAAAQAPSKLGLKPGQTIEVATAIRAMVTKSANDVAVVVAEALADSEPEFAKLMTAKARALSMKHTTYRNASGLPDDAQITTARDQAILGRAINDRFPQYYHYFSTRSFAYHGHVMHNHNQLLGRVDGVDGIKTGYIHESGFNIVTSVHRGGRHIVAVVFGGRSAAARDARAISLIANNINVAAVKRTAPPVIEGSESAVAHAKDAKEPKEAKETKSAKEETKAKFTTAAAPAPVPAPKPGSTAPIKPTPVKTVAVQSGTVMHTASLSTPLPSVTRSLRPAPATANPVKITNVATVKSEPPPPALLSSAQPEARVTHPVKNEKVASADDSVPVLSQATDAAAKARGGWIIQVGAFDGENEAKERLALAKDKAKAQLDEASPFTESISKGDKKLYRARFAGLEKTQAEIACKHLRRSDIPCMLLRD